MSIPDAYPINGKQKNAYHSILNNPPVAPDFARGGVANPNLRVFVANFDGTGNDRDLISKGEQASLVAASDAGLHRIIEDSDAQHIATNYYAGVGTRTGTIKGLTEKIWGVGCERNAKSAHADFVKQVAAWKKDNPNCEIHVHAVGFSRGAAIALHFLNLVDRHGAYKKESAPVNEDRFSPGNVKSSAVLYDNVSTGQGVNLELGVPKSTVAVLHLTAGGEQRELFPLHSVDNHSEAEASFVKGASMMNARPGVDGRIRYQRIQEIELPAARHSDVGGTYVGGGIREVAKFLADHFQHSLGFPIEPEKPNFMHVQRLKFHDSRIFKINNETEDLQKSVRAVRQSETKIERKNFVIHTRIEGVGSRAKNITNFKAEHLVDIPGALDFLAGSAYELRIGYDPSGNQSDFPGKPNLQLISETGPFTLSEGVINFSGSPLLGIPSLDEIEEGLRDKSIANENRPGSVKIRVDLRRVGIRCEVTRSAEAPDPVWYKNSKDPMPREAMSAMHALNRQSSVTSSEGSTMINLAMFGVAKQIQKENPDVDSVRIYPVVNMSHLGSGAKRNNQMVIECVMKDRSLIEMNGFQSSKKIAQFQGDLRAQGIILDALSNELRERGVNPTRACDQTFENGCDRPKRSQSMDGSDASSSIPIRISSYTSSILSTLGGGAHDHTIKSMKHVGL